MSDYGQKAYEAFQEASGVKAWKIWESLSVEEQLPWLTAAAAARKRQPPRPKAPKVTVWWISKNHYDEMGNRRKSLRLCSGQLLPVTGWRCRVKLEDGRIIRPHATFKSKRAAVAAFVKAEIGWSKGSLRSAAEHERWAKMARKL